MVLLVSVVPDQCAFEHCNPSIRVNRENGDMRVGNDAKKLLPCAFRAHLSLNTFVDIGTGSCETDGQTRNFNLVDQNTYQTTSRLPRFLYYAEAVPGRDTNASCHLYSGTGIPSRNYRPYQASVAISGLLQEDHRGEKRSPMTCQDYSLE